MREQTTHAACVFPQDDVLGACYRGCRLFSICHFVDVIADLNTTRAECESGNHRHNKIIHAVLAGILSYTSNLWFNM